MLRRRPGQALRARRSHARIGPPLARVDLVERLRRLHIRLSAAVTGALLALSALLAAPVGAFAAGPLAAIDPVTQTLANDIIQTFTNWVAAGASWVLGQVVTLLTANTAINLNAQWFMGHYATMTAMALMVMLPLLCAAAAKSALTGDPALALRAAMVYLPLAIIGIFMAVPIVNMLLQIVDYASAVMAQSLGTDFPAFSHNIACSIDPAATGCPGGGTGATIAAPFVIFISAVFMVIFGLLIFIELLFRNAAVYATAIFIPLALATIVFPGTAKIAKRLIETLFGLILLKFFIVAVFSIGVAALGAQSGGGNFTTVLGGIVVLILAAVLPNLLIGLLPLVEGAAIATIASRTTTTQIIQPTSNQIYTSIRRQNELRSTNTGFSASSIAAGSTGAAGGAALLGAASSGGGGETSLLGTRSSSMGGIAPMGGGVSALAGAGAASGDSGVGSVGVAGGSILGGSAGVGNASGAVASIPAAATLGAVTGISTRRVRGGKPPSTAGPATGG